MRLRRPVAVAVVCGVVALLTLAASRARAAARDVPISPVTADWFVGPTFPERAGLATDERPVGELDDLSELDGADFAADAVDPEVRRFYERTSAYRMTYRATWHRPFRTGAALAGRVTNRVENLNLPAPGDRGWYALESRFVGVVEPAGDHPGRDDPRAWVRTDPETGEAVFVALYATQSGPTGRLVNIAAPLPASNVSTVLRPTLVDDEEATLDDPGIRLTTRGAGDPGLYLRTPLGVFAAPMAQEFRVWATPEEDWDLGAVHEMWLCGRRFLTVDYRVWRADEDGTGSDQ